MEPEGGGVGEEGERGGGGGAGVSMGRARRGAGYLIESLGLGKPRPCGEKLALTRAFWGGGGGDSHAVAERRTVLH